MKNKVLLGSVLIMVLLLVVNQSSYAQQFEYDPTIHFYQENLDGQGIGRIETRGNPPIPNSWEEGSGHWGRYVGGGTYWKGEDNVRYNSCGGGDDALADFYYVPEDSLFQPLVSSYNGTTWAHIYQSNGLDGFYYCVGGYCTVSLCTTQVPTAQPSSLSLYWP